MSERGVFAVDRGIWDHDLLTDSEPFSRREAWLWLVSEAAWKPHKRRIIGRSIQLSRGQYVGSLRFIASKWRWSEPRVRRFLTTLISAGMIDAKTDAGVTVVTVCKYEQYQRVSLPTDATRERDVDACATQERRKVEDRENKETSPSLRSGESAPRMRAQTREPSETLSQDLQAAPERPRRQAPRSTVGLKALGTELPANWVPSEAMCEACKVNFGMTDDDLRTELPAFHALNVQNSTYSPDWNQTFYLFCKRWKEYRDKQPAPRVQLSRAPAPKLEDLTEADWDRHVKFYATTGRWARDIGPDPMHVGRCKAPQHVLDRYGINPETGERPILPAKQAVNA